MKDFIVHLVTSVSTTVTVEAYDHDQALELATESVYAPICHQCASHVEMAGEWEPVCVIDDETNEILWEEAV